MSEPTSRNRRILQIVLPLAVLAIGAGATMALVASREEPARVERPALGPLVEVTEVRLDDVEIEVVGQGEVTPRVKVELAPQVGGRVIEVHPALVTGGRFRAHTILLRIDPRDYELAVERARAAVAAAETVLERELAEADAAGAEWREVNGDTEPPELLVRGPQIREARARLAAAVADLSAAELALERTRLRLPFDGVVIEESADVGQLVAAGQRVATVYGSDAVEIRLPLDDRELAWIDLPQRQSTSTASTTAASVEAEFAGTRHTWAGRVDRLEGQVDARSRMVRLVVVVEDPLAGEAPLLPGTFVDIALVGRALDDIAVIPRHALRSGDTVWLVDGETLEIRDVEVLRRERQRVLIGKGLEGGERLITSSLDAVTQGMKVRLPEDMS